MTLLCELDAAWGETCSESTDLTFFSMYSTSEGKWEFCTSNSVRSASSRQEGGSLGCRVGGSLRMRRILNPADTCIKTRFIIGHSFCFVFVFTHEVFFPFVYTGTHLRAIERTLVLFLTRCRMAEFELEAGAEDSVWTYKGRKEKHEALAEGKLRLSDNNMMNTNIDTDILR